MVSLDFSVTYSFRPYHGPGVDSAPSENEYQEHFLGVKAAGAWGWQPHHFHVPNVMKIWEPKPPGTLWATLGLLRGSSSLWQFYCTSAPFIVPVLHFHLLPPFRGNSFSIMTRLWDGWCRVWIPTGTRDFFSAVICPDWLLGPPSLIFSRYQWLNERGYSQNTSCLEKMLYSKNETTYFGLYWPSSGFHNTLRRVYRTVWERVYRLFINYCGNLKMANKGRNM